MSIALDIMIPAVMVLTAAVGYRKGFVRYAVKLLGTVTCIVVALVLSGLLAAPIYDGIVAPRLEAALNEQFEDFDITGLVRKGIRDEGTDIELSDKQLKKALSDRGSLPAAFERAVKDAGGSDKDALAARNSAESFFSEDFGSRVAEAAGFEDNEEFGKKLDMSIGKVYDLVRAFASGEDNSAGVNYLVTNVLDGVMTTLIRFVLFAVLFIICEAVCAVIFAVAGVFDHLPMVAGINKTGGLILGMLKGVLYVFLIAAVYAAVAKSAPFVSTEDVDKTIVFKYFFRVFYK